MIAYFSGTGNSKHIAYRLASLLGEREPVDMARNPLTSLTADIITLGLVCPIYAWGIPPIVMNWIANQRGKGRISYLWSVLCCGDETGNAPSMLGKALAKSGFYLDALYSVQMPNNYVLLPGFDVDSKSIENEKLIKSQQRIEHIASRIKTKATDEVDVVRGKMPILKTALVYPLFKKWGIFPKKWKVDPKKCTGCGLCRINCPVGNIGFTAANSHSHGFPYWNGNCVSCLACYHICPQRCIAYGKATIGKGHYFFSNKKFK